MKIIQSTLSLLSKMFFMILINFSLFQLWSCFASTFQRSQCRMDESTSSCLFKWNNFQSLRIAEHCLRATATTGAPLSQKCAYETTGDAGGVSPARRSSLFRAVFQLRHIYCLSCLSLSLLLVQFMGVECSVCRATAVTWHGSHPCGT